MGLTATGYSRPTYEDILDDLIIKAQELFGEDIETDELTAFGKFLRIIAYDRSIAEEEAELIYYSRFPNTVSGTSLDRLCPFVGISRNSAIASRYTVQVTGTAGETIDTDFLVSTESGIEFQNLAETTIPENDVDEDGNATCIITVECTEAGTDGNVDPEDITETSNTEATIESVIGIEQIVEGEDEESDVDLRTRFSQATQGLGACNSNSIRAAVLRVSGVSYATVISNDSDSELEIGGSYDNIPAHSFAVFISGSADETEVAQAIFDAKPIGISTYGLATSGTLDDNARKITLTDDSNTEHTVYFNYVENISVDVTLTVTTNSEYEGEDEIISNIEAFIDALAVGEDFAVNELYGYIYSVAGVERVTDLSVTANSKTYDNATDYIEFAAYQKAVFGSRSVKVNE